MTTVQRAQDYMVYLKDLQERDGSRFPIHWEHIDIDSIQAIDHTNRAGLQIADIVASSFFQAVEPNLYGGFEHRYAKELKKILIKSPTEQFLNYGIKPVPNMNEMNLLDDQRIFFEYWRESGQAPGP